MRRLLFTLALIAFLAVFAASQSAKAAANPLGFFWDDSFTHIEDYYHPGALIVAGNCNRYDERFAKARAAGAEVLAYLNPIEVYDRLPCKLNAGFYMGGRENVPLWPYPKYGQRINWPKTRLADMRVRSPWSNHIVQYVTDLMREGKVDGVFLDNIGARVWSKSADWKDWSEEEQDAWTDGNVDLVRRIDAARRTINPRFLIITNNVWDRKDPRGFEGERYVDGIVLERHALAPWPMQYAGRPFGSGVQRRVLVMARTPEDALGWAKVPGVTHVGSQVNYKHPPKPLVPFQPVLGAR
jgi:hypothetical protein